MAFLSGTPPFMQQKSLLRFYRSIRLCVTQVTSLRHLKIGGEKVLTAYKIYEILPRHREMQPFKRLAQKRWTAHFDN